MPSDTFSYKQRARLQALAWINGDSVHNRIDDECTPDFSCCEPECFEQDRHKRIASYNAWAMRNGFARYTDD
jgi:hypothetical protein